MGKDSAIAWTDHTFNPWWGCQKVSPGCANCYAETFAVKRMGLPIWGGDKTERKLFGDKHWAEPLKWNKAAAKASRRARVFCASMADVFEDRPDLVTSRARLYGLVRATPHLDWMLLTKRPENTDRLWTAANVDSWDGSEDVGPVWTNNVWLGTTVENQAMAEQRIPHLLRVPAAVRFLSCEPLLEAIDLSEWIFCDNCRIGSPTFGPGAIDDPLASACGGTPFRECGCSPIALVIIGGESGSKARPFDAEWARSVKAQCRAAGVTFFMKQLGSYVLDSGYLIGRRIGDRAGADPSEWPEDLRVREFPR